MYTHTNLIFYFRYSKNYFGLWEMKAGCPLDFLPIGKTKTHGFFVRYGVCMYAKSGECMTNK